MSVNRDNDPTTGRGFDTHPIDSERDGDLATELYSPHPTADRSSGTRDRQQGSSYGATPARGEEETAGHVSEAFSSSERAWREPASQFGASHRHAYRPSSGGISELAGGVLKRITANPLALVAAATVGGALVGRMTRGTRRHEPRGYLRAIPRERQYQSGQWSSPAYPPPAFPGYNAPGAAPGASHSPYGHWGGQEQSDYAGAPGDPYGWSDTGARQDFGPERWS